MVVLFSVFGRFDRKSFIRVELAPGITRKVSAFLLSVFSLRFKQQVLFFGGEVIKDSDCQEHYRQTDRYSMG